MDFELNLTGDAAAQVQRAAELRGWTLEQTIGQMLAISLVAVAANDAAIPGDPGAAWPLTRTEGIKVGPYTINEGAGGFHVLTFVTDGYGYLIAEDATGTALATTRWESAEDEGATYDEFRRLADETLKRQG